jgi:hypothetical protein
MLHMINLLSVKSFALPADTLLFDLGHAHLRRMTYQPEIDRAYASHAGPYSDRDRTQCASRTVNQAPSLRAIAVVRRCYLELDGGHPPVEGKLDQRTY